MTYREIFKDMPQLSNDRDQSKSQVIAYIREKMNCDYSKAASIFMTGRKSGVMLFDSMNRKWRGCNTSPAPVGGEITYATIAIEKLKKDNIRMEKIILNNAICLENLIEKCHSLEKKICEKPNK